MVEKSGDLKLVKINSAEFPLYPENAEKSTSNLWF